MLRAISIRSRRRGLSAWISAGDLVVMQGNLRPSVTRDCLALAKSKGATTVLNPSPTYAAEDYDWTLVDLVLVNRGEAVELAGGEAEEAARELCKKGAGAVVLTLGADGAAFFSADDAFRVAAPQVIADRRGRSRRRVLRGLDRRQGPRAQAGERRSPPPPKPLRFRSRERASLLPFRPGRRWRVFLNARRSDALRRLSNDGSRPRRRASAGEHAHSPYSAGRTAC